MFSVMKHPAITTGDYRVIALLFTDGVLNWLQNILAFSVLSIVTPLTYAVASASKRIFVIAISLFILGNPVTWVNIFGMLVAIMGVLCYNRAKYFSRHQPTKESILPYTNVNNNIKYKPLEDTTLINGSAHGKNGFVANGMANGGGTASYFQNGGGVANNSSSNSSNNLLLSNSNGVHLTTVNGSPNKLLFV